MGRDAALARPGAARAAVRLVLLGALTAAVLVPAGRAATPAEAWSASGTTVAGQPPSWGSGAAQLYRPESAVVDGSGNTYVADAFNHRIQRWAPGATSGVTVVGGNDCGPAANQLCYPSGVAFDGSGNLFVADTGNLRVQRFAPAGAAFATSGTTVAGGNGWGTNDNQFKAPWSVALDSVGNLYVSDSNNQRVQKFGWDSFNLTFSVGGLTIMGGNGAGSGANQLSYPRGLAIDSFGSVYVADESNGRIQRRTGDGTVTTVAGVSGYSGNTATYLSYPRGVAVDSSLNLYVGDTLNNRVQKFTWTGSSYGASPPVGTTVAGGNGSGTAANQLIGPRGVAVDSSGALFVTDFDSARVQRFAAGSTSSTNATTVAGSSPSWGAGAGQLWDPQGSAVDGSGNLFVADASNHRVQRWAPGATSGTTVAGGNGYGSGANQLAYPTGVALDGSGNLYVADFLNHRVQRFAWNGSSYSTSGTTVAGTGGAGGGTDQLFYPFAVAFDAGGNLYVSDGANARVQQFAWNGSTFATSGTSVAGGGTEGSGANQLSSPRGIALDATGNLFVADQGNARVQKFARSGSTFASSGTTVAGGNGPGLDPNQLSSPGGVAVDGMGNLYVADTYNDRVQRWAPSATSGTTLVGAAGPGSGANQLTRPWAVTLDVAGNLVVTDTENYRVQRWAGNPEAPTIGTVTPSGTSASVAFTPGDPGGAAPKYGGVCTSTNGGTARLTADAALTTSSPAPVVDLTPGGVYTCAAFAVNSAGTSSGSSASASFTVRPAAPTLGVVTPSGTSASVAFTPATGIGAGTSFTATCASSNGGTTRATSGSASPLSVASLTPGAVYSCRVTASNTGGESPASGASPTFIPTQTGVTAAVVTYSGATKVVTGGSFTLTARLTSGTKGVSGKTLWYRFGDGAATALPTATDRNGNTTATVSAPGPAGAYTLWVWFPGDATYRFAGVNNGTAFAVQDKQDTTVLLSSVAPGTLSNLTVSAARGTSQTFTATLTPAVAGETVNFKITQNATTLSNVNATTNGSGSASATIKVPRTAGTYTLTVSHADNAFYGFSTASYVLTLA